MPRQGLEEFSYENVGSTVATPLLSEHMRKIGKPEEVIARSSSSSEEVKRMSSPEISAEALRGQEDSSRLRKHVSGSNFKVLFTTISVGTTLLKREGSVAPGVCSVQFRHIVLRLSAVRELTEDGRLLRKTTTGEWQISKSCRTARFQKRQREFF